MKLTFTDFVQNLIDKFEIAPSMFHLVQPGKRFPYNKKLGWHFSDDVSYCDYEAVLIVANGDKGIANGGIINYTHENGYRLNHRGVAEQLTLDEVAEMFGKPVSASLGLPISPFKGTFKSTTINTTNNDNQQCQAFLTSSRKFVWFVEKWDIVPRGENESSIDMPLVNRGKNHP